MLSATETDGVTLTVSVVWTPMLPGDSARSARAATALVADPRACHYFDPERRAGRAIAARMGGAGKIAWDIYLFFAPGAAWEDEPPLPMDWAHQLENTSWADPARYHRGDDPSAGTGQALAAELARLLRRCSSASPGEPLKETLT